MDNGTFYTLGVGPGDPELLTRKACRILSGCPVIAAPRTASGEMLALDIAKGAVDLTGKEILPLEFAMARQVSARQTGYRKAAEQIAAVLESGRDVAMVNLGDVSIYATAYYVLDVVRSMGFRTEMVPGVPSFCAVAAALGRSLTEPEAPLHVYPAGKTDLDAALAQPGTESPDEVRQRHGRPRPRPWNGRGWQENPPWWPTVAFPRSRCSGPWRTCRRKSATSPRSLCRKSKKSPVKTRILAFTREFLCLFEQFPDGLLVRLAGVGQRDAFRKHNADRNLIFRKLFRQISH